MSHAPDDVLGRYRLLAPCGGDHRVGLEFWHAKDITDGSEVALTLLPGRPVQVAEWTPSMDVGDAVLGAHLPVATVVRLLRPLVETVQAAHHAGLAVGIDSPGRVRIAERGGALVAFPGAAPGTTTRGDVRALGAITYLLLTGCWPVADRDGHLVDPAVLRPDAPRDLATVAALSLDPSPGPDIRTCGPLMHALDQALLPPPPPREPLPEPEPGPPRPHRPRGRQLALAAAVVVVAVAVAFGIQFAGSFGVASPSAAPPATRPAPSTTTTPPPTTTTTTTKPPPPPRPVRPATVREFVVSGSEDNPGTLSRVADGDPATVWKTDDYRQQFPLFSPGIGVLAGFGGPVALSSVTITSPSAGTVVQLRSAAAPGVSLRRTTLLATATLHAGATRIALPAHAARPYLLVWIVRLAGTADGFQSQVAEITAQAAR